MESIVVRGFRWAGIEAGIRKRPGRKDLALLLADGPVACAGVFTQSDMAAAPVHVSRSVARSGLARAVVMNAGCANACTGAQGLAAAQRMAGLLAGAGIPAEQVLIASTGVIGAHLPIAKLESASARLVESARPDGIRDFAHAIMTTDTREKVASRTGTVGGRTVTVAGVSKGAGMIMPNMATMLACVATDAPVTPAVLEGILRRRAWHTFNAITVDGDTSTNDTLYLLASGAAGGTLIDGSDARAVAEIEQLVGEVCLALAKAIAADGEGATKFVEVRVEQATSEQEADVVGRRIANSPLVKTAWHAADANWGRIMAAAGVCGFELDPARCRLWVDDVLLFDQGMGTGVEAENRAGQAMGKADFVVRLELGRGTAVRSVFTCDFSADYVKINAEYRT